MTKLVARPMFKRDWIRIILLVIGSICLGAWMVGQLNRRMAMGNFRAHSIAALTAAVTPETQPNAAAKVSPHLTPTASAALSPQPTLKRAELVAKRDALPVKALPAFVRIKEPVIFPSNASNKFTTTALPIGAKVRVVRVNGSWIWIEKGGNSTFVPVTSTDLEEQMAGATKGDP
jgi:hypothetical protein